MPDGILAGDLFLVAPGEPMPGPRPEYRVRATGEYRRPRKGEWFLSGAVVEGYHAATDLSTAYHIAVLVKGELVWREGSS